MALQDTALSGEALLRRIARLDARRLILFVLFFYIATPAEAPSFVKGAGVVLLIKLACSILFLLTLLACRPRFEDRRIIIFAAGVFAYVFAINIAGLSAQVLVQCLLIFFAILIADFARKQLRDDFRFVLTAFLVFNLLGMTLSVSTYWLTNVVYDFHQIVVPWGKMHATSEMGVVRFTGFQMEPGNYAAWVSAIVLLRSLLIRKIGTLLHTICILSTLVSLSAWAAVGASLYVAAIGLTYLIRVFARRSARNWFFSVAGGVALFVVVLDLLVPTFDDAIQHLIAPYFVYFTARFAGKGAAIGSMISVFAAWAGFLENWHSALFVGRPFATNFCPHCSNVGAGLGNMPMITFLVWYFGAIPLAIFLSALLIRVWRSFGVGFILLLIVPLSSRLFAWDSVFWLIFTVALFDPAKETIRILAPVRMISRVPTQRASEQMQIRPT